MKALKPIGIFCLCFSVFYFLACAAVPTENGVLQVSDHYIVLAGAVSLIFSVLVCRWHNARRLPKDPFVVTDELLDDAAGIVFETRQASATVLQRHLRIGYTRAASLIDLLEQIGVVGPYAGRPTRKITMSPKYYSANKDRLFICSPARERTSAAIELERVDLMDGVSFESWCAELLRALGFIHVETTATSGDHGVDILAEKDGIRYAIQCKCYNRPLGNTPVQEVHAGKEMYHCHIGAVITNQYFTQGGVALAEKTGTLLWDRDWLSKAIDHRNDQ